MNNKWNRIIYKCWSPIYDSLFNSHIFKKARSRTFNDIVLEEGSKVLFVGVGTGADIPFFLNRGLSITAIDYSSDMLKVASDKFKESDIVFMEMDAQDLRFQDESFDFVVASLVLSVVPDPGKVMKEIAKVAKEDSRVLVFDKFVERNKNLHFFQKFLRPVIKTFGTDIGLDFYDIYKVVEEQFELVCDEKVMLKGLYRKVLLCKR